MVASIWQIPTTSFILSPLFGIVNVKDAPYNAAGDGIEDDYAAIQAALTYAAGANLALYFPPGTYRLATAGLNIADYNNFVIFGAGKYLSVIKRDAADVGTVLNVLRCDNVEVANLGFDGGYDLFPGGSANQAFTYNDCENVIGRNLYATNFKNGGINAFVTGGTQKRNIHFIECDVDGRGVANNGINLVNTKDSGIDGCHVVGCPGAPGYGLQLKNKCDKSYIRNSYVEGCKAGIAFGNDIAAEGVINSQVSNISVYNCTNGVVTGYASHNQFTDIAIDMNDIVGWGIDLDNQSHNNNFTGVKGKNVNTGRSLIRVRSGNGNVFDVSSLQNTTINSSILATIDATVTNTLINIDKVYTPGFNPWDRLVDDNSGNATNVFLLGKEARTELIEIVSGAVTVTTGGVRMIRLETEALAASDDLDNILGPAQDNSIIYLQTSASTRDVVVRDNAVGGGNISLVGAGTFTLGSVSATIGLMWKANVGRWVEVSRANI
jgi:hypothetical protein